MLLQIADLGRIDYQKGLDLQYALIEKCSREEIPDTLLLLEHPHVVTLGKRGENSDLLFSEEILKSRGISTAWVDRGGQATYHGPGQLVGYPIINLRHHQRKIKRFVHNIETFLIELLGRHYHIQCHTEDEYVGVWVENSKIAAIGISIHKGVSMHGFALNVCTDLNYFSYIIPCGISGGGRGVTSISKELGNGTGGPAGVVEVTVAAVMQKAGPLFAEIFGYEKTASISRSSLEEQLQ